MSHPTPWIALLRGVNVGGHRKLPMADLRRHMEALGHTSVQTYIQSGNAVFKAALEDPAQAARQIEAALLAGAGIETTVAIRSRAQLAAIITEHPFLGRDVDPKQLHVSFCVGPLDPTHLAAADPSRWAPASVAYMPSTGCRSIDQPPKATASSNSVCSRMSF